MTFAELNLNRPLWNALEEMGLVTPTAIQAKSFSPIMSGKDIIGIAQTGTGKTYAYLLPSLRLWQFTKSPHPQILVIVPTRELVMQVVTEAKKLTEYMNVEIVGVYGGTNIKTHKAEIEVGVDLVVGTPGRLVDLLKDGV
ncbi:MAG: DEAD/DEAH box helicase, partial [Bacteroidota bacterium]